MYFHRYHFVTIAWREWRVCAAICSSRHYPGPALMAEVNGQLRSHLRLPTWICTSMAVQTTEPPVHLKRSLSQNILYLCMPRRMKVKANLRSYSQSGHLLKWGYAIQRTVRYMWWWWGQILSGLTLAIKKRKPNQAVCSVLCVAYSVNVCSRFR